MSRSRLLPGCLAAALLSAACATPVAGTAVPAGPPAADRPAAGAPAPLTAVHGFADLTATAGPEAAAVAIAPDGGNGLLVWLDRDPTDDATGSVLVDVGPVTAEGGGDGPPLTPEPVSSVALPEVASVVDVQAAGGEVLVVGEVGLPGGGTGWGFLRVDAAGQVHTVPVGSAALDASQTRSTVLTEGGDTLVLALGAVAAGPSLVAVDAADGGVLTTADLPVPGATTARATDVALEPDGDLVVALDVDVDVRGEQPRAVLVTVAAGSAEAAGEPLDVGSEAEASRIAEVAVAADGTAWATVAGWDAADPQEVTWRLVGAAGDVLQDVGLPAGAALTGHLALDPAGLTAYLTGSLQAEPHLFAVDLATGATEAVRLTADGGAGDVAVAADGRSVWVAGSLGDAPGVWLVG